ncbi:MAG: DUF721 domain-containing protein [Pseudomonadota bacterium]
MGDDTAKPKRRRKGADAATAPPPRKSRGFLRAAELTPATLRTTGAKRGFAELRLLTEWRAIVGDALAGVCRPLKVSYGGRGAPGLGATLFVTAEGARAPEIEASKVSIIDRVNAFYGYRAVSRLTIDQRRSPLMAAASQGFAEDAADFAGAPERREPGVQDAEASACAPRTDVKDERLALALARLEANVKARAKSTDLSKGSRS